MKYGEARAEFQFWYFHAVLVEKRGSMSRAARAAGLHRTDLYRKLDSVGLAPADLRCLRIGVVDYPLGGVSRSA